MLITILSTVIVLGILIFVHELGHFILAKKLGVKVLKFSLGFGRKLIGKKIGETEYQIAVFPLGGYVKLVGENPEEEITEEDRLRSFQIQPIWKRILIIVAGPCFNFILSILIFTFINPFMIVPADQSSTPAVIFEITKGMPAERAGFQKGDKVISINGKEISTWDELSIAIRESKGKELTVRLKRRDKIFETKIIPLLTEDKGKKYYRIGIANPGNFNIVPKFEIGNGFKRTAQTVQLTIFAVTKIIQGEISARDALGGPIAIAQMAGQQARKGLVDFIYLIGMLGVSLGLINLLPIPILDGGHILFMAIEAIFGKPLTLKQMEIAQQIGLILIILLMLFAFYNDIMRVFSQKGFKF